MSSYEAVIGLEVHVQLDTKSKIFATSSTESGNDPNTQTDVVTLGLPGCLPVLNKHAVVQAIKLGVATECDIREKSVFARKHYFYPDLPKGYQISQYDLPICENGVVRVNTDEGERVFELTRIHMEEDAGKNIHSDSDNCSLVDLNRAGVPLAEIVSEPCMHSSEDAVLFLKRLRQLVRYIGVCDGNMESGNLRCDANISVRPSGEKELGTKVEIKNLNSFKYVEKAIEYEIERQIALCENGQKSDIVQETRLWDDASSTTKPMRSKEQAQDYRYMPDPDLLPLVVDEGWISEVKKDMTELPHQSYQRLRSEYGFDHYMSSVISEERASREFFDEAIAAHNNPSLISNWITSELYGKLNKEGLTIEDSPISAKNLAGLVKLIDENIISGKIAKSVFEDMFLSGKTPDVIVEEKGLKQITDDGQIKEIIQKIIDANPNQVEQYRSGKDKLFGFFVGQVMKETQGKANPGVVNKLLKELLSS